MYHRYTYAFILFQDCFHFSPLDVIIFLSLTFMFSVTHGNMACTKPLGLSCLIYILTLDLHFWSYISRFGDLWNLNRWGLVFQFLIPTCKNVSFMLSCLYFQALAPDDLGGCGLICYPLILSEAPSVSPQTHTHSNHGDDTPFQQLCSRPYEMGQWKSLHLQHHHHDASAFLCYSHYSAPSPPPDSLSLWGVLWPPLSALTCCLYCQAGLLGCEAVLSSMALMQANNIPGQKRMTSSLGQGQRASPESHQTHTQHSHNHHGHQVHHGQAHHSHMGHPSAGSCPPLVRGKTRQGHSGNLLKLWFLNFAFMNKI